MYTRVLSACPLLGGLSSFRMSRFHCNNYYPFTSLSLQPFPWGDGDTSLFHNPHVNLGPEKPEGKKRETFRVSA